MDVLVYILKGSDNTFYTGLTKCLQKRLEQHYAGESKSTKHKRPLELVWHDRFQGYKAARVVEKYIKSKGALKFLTQESPHKVY